ncbi:hypothetical protein [Actinomadura chokoriensis]|uniref:Uncharacterized protein n=1 Tax=Actinomadura chokoriensis TaxID=454156 RepID=A0ABV4R8H5_9ACTN
MAYQTATPADQSNKISLGAVLTLPVLFVLAGVLVLFNLLMSALVLTGPDSCGEVSCSGSPLFAKIFLGIAIVPAVASIATVFTLRPSRFGIRCALIATALAVPGLADLITISATPDWFA